MFYLSSNFFSGLMHRVALVFCFEGMYHNLTVGETDENVDIVFNDVASWVMERI